MTKEEDFKLLKIQTCILKVNLHCDGCKHKVKKILQRIEGVYTVNIDAEHQKVTVSGNVDSATLIKKLVRAGKHAELWSQKSNQNQKHQPVNCIKDDKSAKDPKQGLMKGLKGAPKNQQKLPSFSDDEDEDDFDDDEDEDDEEEEFRLLREKANRLVLLKQINDANAKKMPVQINQNQNKGGPGNGSAGKKVGGGGNPNQNVALKNPNGIEHKSGNIGVNNKMNAGLHIGGGLNPNLGEAKKLSELNMNPMGLGLHGHGGGMGGLTGNLGGFQVQQPSTLNGLSANGFGGYPQPSPGLSNLQGYQHFPSSMGMNMHARPGMIHENRYVQPQMMYQRAPYAPPYTGYYQYYPSPSYQSENADFGAHIFNDDNTSSCVVM